MAKFSARVKRSFFRSIWEQCPSDATSFLEALKAGSTQQIQSVAGGGYLVASTSQPGHSFSFNVQADVTPLEFAELCEYGIDLYQQAQATGCADEEAIWAYFESYLRPIKSIAADFTNIRQWV